MNDARLRTVYLLELLRNTDERHPATLSVLAQRLAHCGTPACERTVSSDIAALRDAGYCIPAHTDRRRGYYLAEPLLEDHELKLLCDLVEGAAFLPQSDTLALVKKLLTLGSPTAGQAVRRSSVIDAACKNRNTQTRLAMDVVTTALALQKKMSFAYTRGAEAAALGVPAKGMRVHTVSPYYTLCRDGQYYLLCNINGRNGLSLFRVENMRMPALCREKVESRVSVTPTSSPRFSPADYMHGAVGMYMGASVRITLLCEAPAIPALRDQFGTGVIYRTAGENRFCADLRAHTGEGLLRFLAAHGDEITLLSPGWMQRRLAARLREAAERLDGETEDRDIPE